VLDLSNVRTVSHTTAQLHIEKLQQGCPKLRVLRITNSELVLSTVSLKEQVNESPLHFLSKQSHNETHIYCIFFFQGLSEGFPLLEELSVAGVVENIAKPFIDDDSLQRILKSSHKLRLLDVRGCSRVTDSSLVRVPAWDLEHLFLSGIHSYYIY
jgi:F-box/leucine-rich repeat protein 6